jgi:hypothetical protein
MIIDTFRTYYWQKPIFQKKELRDAYDRLVESAAPQKELNEAFKVLLKSNVDIAQGIAFDLFYYWQTLDRWAINNPYLTFSTMLLGTARRQLQRPPVKNGDVIGANHASALSVLLHLGDAEDILLIEPIVRASQDINVIDIGISTLGNCLDVAKNIPPHVFETLSRFVLDEDQDISIRSSALRALTPGTIGEPMAPEVEKLCLHVAQHGLLKLSMWAALDLGYANLPRHRAFLEKLVANWPHEYLYPGSEVRGLLENQDAEQDFRQG